MYGFSIMFSDPVKFSIADFLLYTDIQLSFVLFVLWLACYVLANIPCNGWRRQSGWQQKIRSRGKIIAACWVLVIPFIGGYLWKKINLFLATAFDIGFIKATLPVTVIDWGIIAFSAAWLLGVVYFVAVYCKRACKIIINWKETFDRLAQEGDVK